MGPIRVACSAWILVFVTLGALGCASVVPAQRAPVQQAQVATPDYACGYCCGYACGGCCACGPRGLPSPGFLVPEEGPSSVEDELPLEDASEITPVAY